MEKKRILIIDDDKKFLEMIKSIVRQKGIYEVVTMTRARDIIDKIHDFKPHLILLDLVMPEVGGIEACEMLNNDSLGKAIPVIVISGLEKDSDKLKAYKKGIVDYITKPIKFDELFPKIEKAIQPLREE